jgi:hypothetical protein
MFFLCLTASGTPRGVRSNNKQKGEIPIWMKEPYNQFVVQVEAALRYGKGTNRAEFRAKRLYKLR